MAKGRQASSDVTYNFGKKNATVPVTTDAPRVAGRIHISSASKTNTVIK